VRRLNFLLTLCYPPAVHFALLSAQPDWALWLLVTVCGSQIAVNLLLPNPDKIALILSGGVLALCLYSLTHKTLFALYLPPIIISATLLWLFARSLQGDREPLITALARNLFQERDPEVLHYTRRVTQLWSLFILGMLLECLLLALLAPVEVWSLFVNILNYLFIGLLFLLEFIYRRIHFSQRSSVAVVLRQLRHADWSRLLRGQQP
jgi:uncharacterized membrane protein